MRKLTDEEKEEWFRQAGAALSKSAERLVIAQLAGKSMPQMNIVINSIQETLNETVMQAVANHQPEAFIVDLQMSALAHVFLTGYELAKAGVELEVLHDNTNGSLN